MNTARHPEPDDQWCHAAIAAPLVHLFTWRRCNALADSSHRRFDDWNAVGPERLKALSSNGIEAEFRKLYFKGAQVLALQHGRVSGTRPCFPHPFRNRLRSISDWL